MHTQTAGRTSTTETNSHQADGLLAKLPTLPGNHPEDGAARNSLAKVYGASIHHITAAIDATRAADMAEALVELRNAVESQPGVAGLIRRDIVAAIELAVGQNDADAEWRLRAAREALFGG